jgi:tripartite-type tricarboxylate transporter receptor subunit TctC
MRRRPLLAMAATAAAAVAPADAQTGGGWPQRTVTLVVPSAPGGTLDALARFFAQAMAPALGRGMVVENVSGAGGLIGMQRAARAEPDGHTLVFGNMGVMAAAVALNPDGGYDPRRDLAPVGLAAHVPMVLAASPQSGVRDLGALLARIRERGERVTFGTAGLGTTSHLAPALLLHLTGLKATLVSYRGAGPAMNDLAAGVVDAVIDQTVTMIPAHRGRTAVALAVTGSARVPQLPEVPTFAEAGVPTFDLVVWNAIAAPRGTPSAVVDRVAAAVDAALADEELRRRLGDLAALPPAREERGPDHLRRRIASDVERWTAVVQAAGLAQQ